MLTLKFKKNMNSPELSMQVKKESLKSYLNKFNYYHYIKVYDEEGLYQPDQSHMSALAVREMMAPSNRQSVNSLADTLAEIMSQVLDRSNYNAMKLTDEEKAIIEIIGGTDRNDDSKK